MHASKFVTFATAGVLCLLVSGPATAADNVVGTWFDDTGRGAVQISRCGSELCGRIFWLKNPTDAHGRPLTDRLNPDPRNRERPICGLQVIRGLERQPDGTWDNGRIYDPKQGAAFDVQISLVSPDHLEVLGYKGLKLFSRRFVWSRAPETLEPCTVQSG